MPAYVYFFGAGKADGNGGQKALLGGKGAGLAEMTNAGVPVPPGFTITTECCNLYTSGKGVLPRAVTDEGEKALQRLEALMGRRLGDANDPLLVSVRSGAKFSMPGMMDTILNLGLNDASVQGLSRKTGNPRFAWDAYRRFLQMFGNVVLDIDKGVFEHALSAEKRRQRVTLDTALAPEALQSVVKAYQRIIRRETGRDFPQDSRIQLAAARDAVFRSWMNERAITYRKLNHIPHDLGTAVNVQSMVFGNKGETSATGVGFTRNPATGEKAFYGEFLTNAQGEDVVAGTRTPRPIAELELAIPAAYRELREITSRLERHYRDVQDFEFTIEEDRLYMLQTRSGKRTGPAAVRIAVDMVAEGLITKEEALLRVDPESLNQLLHPVFDPVARRKVPVAAKGLPASPGAASGAIALTAEKALAEAAKGRRVVLVRAETCPDDIGGMHAAQGVLTATGGMTSHAAVVGRQMGKPSVVGCAAVDIDDRKGTLTIGTRVLKEGDCISIDGSTGEVIAAELPTVPSEVLRFRDTPLTRAFQTFLGWADAVRRLQVRANADTPADARMAVRLGAQGIGLCRTEHMFFNPGRIQHVVKMILAAADGQKGLDQEAALLAEIRQARGGQRRELRIRLSALHKSHGPAMKSYRQALKALLPMQRGDFEKLFTAMEGRPVTIRTLDPPLHEFLPKREELMVSLARKPNAAKARLLRQVEDLHEFNPMLGHRGCRLGITYPEITRMQGRAIFEAAARVIRKGIKVHVEIMVPLVGNVEELRRQKLLLLEEASEVGRRSGISIPREIGTMIELPRAAVTADRIATEAAFFSFGTNDLTQTALGLSRDDSGKFLPAYVDQGILARDPFVALDQEGVGELMRMAVTLGRKTRPDIHLGICGEHGGEPSSVIFCHALGLDYVSCSPYRLPVARLAAAQAVLQSRPVSTGSTGKS